MADRPSLPRDSDGERGSKREKFLKLARDRFRQAQDAEKDQRTRELDDLKFYAGDQWPSDIRNARKASGEGALATPARPCMTINNTREPVRQVLNQERAADMGIEIVPADDFGDLGETPDETEITLREGLTRRIQRESKAADARTWAFMRSTIAGRGFYGVMTRYVPGKTRDQEVYVHRYYNQACVTLDPAHEQPDGSDAEWGFVGTDLTWDAYKAEYKKRNGKDNRVCDWTDDDWRGLGDESKDWFREEGNAKTRICRVVDYWYTERETRELVAFARPDDPDTERVEWADEVEGAKADAALVADLAGWVEVEDSRRHVIQKSIKWCKLDGCDDDVLDETDWPGPDLPIVKVLGEELQPYDKERRVEGMVRPMREPGQGLNYMVSRWVEMIGLSPLSPVLMAAGQDEGFEEEWNAINTRTLGRVHYNQVDSDERPAPPPFANPAQNIPIDAIAGSVQLFKQALQSTSGVEAAALGQADSSVRSNKQAKLLVEQSRQGSSHFLDNLQRSMRYEAQIINNLLYPIYGRKGRIARILNKEGDAERVLLHQPMVMQGDLPVPAEENDPNAKKYTLTRDAQFNVILKISKNFDSRREQENQILGSIIEAEPSLMTVFGDLFFKSMDGPGHNQMAERAKVMLDPKIQQFLASKAEGQNVPPEIQAQLAAAQQQIEQLTQQLQEASAPGAAAQVKAQADLQTTQAKLEAEGAKANIDAEKVKLEADLKWRIAQLQAETELLKVDKQEATKLQLAEYTLRGKAMQTEIDAREQDLGVETQAAQQDHEREMAERGHEQSLEQSELQAGVSAEQAEAQRAHEAEMAAQAAQQGAQ